MQRPRSPACILEEFIHEMHRPLERSHPPATATTSATSEHDQQMKERTLEGFGSRLAELRQARGLSREELAGAVDVSRRVIACYEAQSAQPPGALLVDLARALKVSTAPTNCLV